MPYELSEEEIRQVRAGVREKYDRVAAQGAAGCFQYPTGPRGLQEQGYPPEIIDKIPQEVLESYCGVGNPFSLGPIYSGEAVLDIGCGAGVDSLVAACLVGPQGRVVGIDVTEEMINRARVNLSLVAMGNVTFQVGEAESLPFPDNHFDVAISNGVLNLTVNKEKALREAHRVLKPGGRLMVADMVLVADLPPDQAKSADAWSQ